MTDAINKALDLIPYNPGTVQVVPEDGAAEEQIADDVKFAREKLYDAVEKSQQAVEDMLTIAQQSQHPKAYEVLNSAIKTMADVAMGLADLQMKKQRLTGRTGGAGEEGGTTTNNLFVGSTAELQQMLENMKKGE